MCEEINNSNIYIFDNLIDDKLCNEIIRIYNIKNINQEYACISKIEDRNTDYKVYNRIIELLTSFVNVNKYVNFNYDSGYIIYNYKEGINLIKEDISSDKEYFSNLVKTMVLIISLDDKDEKGEFIFPYQKEKIKLKKGTAILFPSFWTHPYEMRSTLNDCYFLKTFILESCCWD